MSWQGKLTKIDEYRWMIPKDYKPGMRVPGIIYATEKMIKQIIQDQAPEQVANVAHLPGIVKYSLAMPDIHWGYGFCIGGVAATDPEKNGVISPGGVGYDISCLHGDTKIIHSLGYTLPIKEFVKNPNHQIKCIDFEKVKLEEAPILFYLKRKVNPAIFKIVTQSGREIEATSDHPFYTPRGMVELRNLRIGDKIGLFPFEGVDYVEPEEKILVDKERLRKHWSSLNQNPKAHGFQQIINQLLQRQLLPLKTTSSQFPYLLKIMGYLLGDGTMYFENKHNKGKIVFYGKEEDLELIKKDIERIGFTAKLYRRHRNHKIKTPYNIYQFQREEVSLKVNSSSLALLLWSLGMPLGNKAAQDFSVPTWLFELPLWQKRLFLASFFGAELTSPHSIKEHGFNFYMPVLGINKNEKYINSGRKLLFQISKILKEFDINTKRISQRKENVNKKKEISYRLRLLFSSSPQNLCKLWSKIGFEYNLEKQFLANIATHYIKLKGKYINDKILNEGIKSRRGKKHWKESQREELWELVQKGGRKLARPFKGKFPTFEEFIEKSTQNLGKSGMVWDEIINIEEIPYNDYVYDFTVEHKDHNFIANGFVVSNCGVRLIRTDLSYEEVKHKIRDIVHALYVTVPAGVGSKGEIRVSHQEEKQLMLKGARWAVEKGYGVKEDLEHCEEYGAIDGANPDKVSQRAYERGKAQAGTLGSGNHFLEVQVVDQIYDEEITNKLGIYLGSITIMIHTGSRGFGYQICDDYIRVMNRAVQKYGIKLPDRQLACAPINSPEAQDYISAMRCAANYAWANRQCITYLVRKALERVFNKNWESLGLDLIYDVAHNIAKFERHKINGEEKTLCVHRKGATRAFPPAHPDLPEDYKDIGQPVIIPGDMGTNSYLLIGTEKAMKETFGSTCHGAGRLMSRSQAIKKGRGRSIAKELESQGIIVMASGRETLAEEMPEAYKDVNDVVEAVVGAGISRKVCRMRPLGVVKG